MDRWRAARECCYTDATSVLIDAAGLGLQQTGAARCARSLGTVLDLELLVDPREMHADRLCANEQAFADLSVRSPSFSCAGPSRSSARARCHANEPWPRAVQLRTRVLPAWCHRGPYALSPSASIAARRFSARSRASRRGLDALPRISSSMPIRCRVSTWLRFSATFSPSSTPRRLAP